MRSNPVPGLVLFALGLGVAGLGVVGVTPSAWGVWPPVGAGLGLGLFGILLLVRELGRAPPLPPPKTAAKAFLETTRHALPVPPKGPIAPAAASAASGPTGPVDAEAARLDAEIRTVSREIDRAKVMYGTGKLSREGYSRYVAELTAKRGELEAALLRLAMRKA